MKKFLLLFLSAPTVLSAVLPLVAAAPTFAQNIPQAKSNSKFCINAHAKLVCVKSSQLASNSPTQAMLIAKAQADAKNPDAFVNFNDEESDGAVALFGCDCPACIRSLRQLRTMAQVG
jgi:hypothetical protein